MTEKTPIQMHLFMRRSFIFVKMVKQHMGCLDARLLSNNLRSSELSKPQQFRIIARVTS